MTKIKSFKIKVRGRKIKCTPIGRQEYTNCAIESGKIKGHPVDTIYLRVTGDKYDPVILLLRPDEAEAIIWVLSGALWSEEIKEVKCQKST